MKLTDIATAVADSAALAAAASENSPIINKNINDIQSESADFLNGTVEQYDNAFANIANEYGGKDCTFSDVENIVKQLLSSLPKINYNEIRKEINQMEVIVYEDPTTFQINEALAKVQTYKDRLTYIFSIVDREFTVRKRVIEMLFDANQAISKQSSSDKRRGEATIRWPVYLIEYANIEAFRSELNNIIINMRAKGDMISRQASILSIQVNLGEYRRRSEMVPTANSNAEEIDYKSQSAKLFANTKTNIVNHMNNGITDWNNI